MTTKSLSMNSEEQVEKEMNVKLIKSWKDFPCARIPNHVLKFNGPSFGAKVTLGRLIQYAGADNRAYPSMGSLAKELDISPRQARRYVKSLEDYGLLIVVQPNNTKNSYNTNFYFFPDHPCYHEKEKTVNDHSIIEAEAQKIANEKLGKTPGFASPSPMTNMSPLADNSCPTFSENGTPGVTSSHEKKPGSDTQRVKEEKTNLKNLSKNSTNSSDEPFEEEKKKGKTPPAKKFSDEDFSLSEKIFQAILKINPTVKKPNMDSWANVIRLMREQDKRSHHEIWQVFDFSNKDQFWRMICLSPASLRRNYSKIAGKLIENGGSLHPPKAQEEPEFRCKDCGFLDRGPKFCGPNGKLTPNAPACCNFAAADPEVAEMLRNRITRRCA